MEQFKASTRNSPSVEALKHSLNTYAYAKTTFYLHRWPNWASLPYTTAHKIAAPWTITCATGILLNACWAAVVRLKQLANITSASNK